MSCFEWDYRKAKTDKNVPAPPRWRLRLLEPSAVRRSAGPSNDVDALSGFDFHDLLRITKQGPFDLVLLWSR